MEDNIQLIPIEDMIFEFVISALSETQDWGLIYAGIPEAHTHSKGKGVTVAVLDTGISSHIDLDINALPAMNASASGSSQDSQGHGCIAPNDTIYTSLCGIQEIKTLFERAPGMNFKCSDGAIIKNTSRYDINTLSFNPLSHKMESKKIEAIHKIPYSGDIYKVKTREGELSLTPWHPVYVCTSKRGDDWSIIKKRADELNIGDKIVCSSETDENIGDYVKLPISTEWVCIHCGYRSRGGKRSTCRKCSKRNWHSGPIVNYITLDEKLAFWCGLVASDGHVMKSSQSIEFFNNNLALIKIFEDLYLEIFGKLPRNNIVADRNCHRRRLHDRDAYNLIQLIGVNKGNKSLTLDFPEVIAKSPKSVILNFVAGYIECDGSVDKNGRIRIATGSEKFAKKLVVLLRTIGIRASYHLTKTTFSGKHKESLGYSIRVAYCPDLKQYMKIKTISDKRDTIKEKQRCMVSITKINIENYIGDMYDFTIQDNHNYVANGMIVSNTHVAGIIAAAENGVGVVGIAPEAKILPIKVLNDNGQGGFDQIIRGLRMAIDAKADIVNMSLGAPISPPPAMDDIIKEAYSKGIILVAAAGNDAGAVNYPARYNEVIAVGAIDHTGNLAKFSSRGDQIACVAPGVNIYSTYLNNQYAILNGTSQASPFMAGVCALLISWAKANPDKCQINNGQDMLKLIDDLCDPQGRMIKGKEGFIGYGIPQFANFMPWKNPAV